MTNEFLIYFDGGCNGINGYGSWEVEYGGFLMAQYRIPFLKSDYDLPNISCNTAEYLSLIGALEWLQSVHEKHHFTVKIYGDSKLLIEQVHKRWKTKKPHLKQFRDDCLYLLKDFQSWKALWHGRINNVRRFGH